MAKFEVTVQRTVVHTAKIMIEVLDQGEGDPESEACKAAALLAEEDQGNLKPTIEWELEYDDFDTLEAYEVEDSEE